MKNILFRADSSSTIGTGHVMRDLVLADQFEDSTITFAVQDLDGNINHKIIENKHAIKLLESNDVNEVIALVKELNIDLIVIDHYGIDADYEKELKDATLVQVLSFDDTYEKHYCDILLNHNVYADKLRYKGLVPDCCELRCGSEFTLLREEFVVARKKLFKNTPTKVLIVMGGADSSNKNIEILECIEQFQNLHLHVVTTTANQYLEDLERYVRNRMNVTIHINSNNIAQLMSDADIAVLTPSVIVNEALYMGLPFVAIQTASNQVYMTEYLKNKSYLIMENFECSVLVDFIKVLLRQGAVDAI